MIGGEKQLNFRCVTYVTHCFTILSVENISLKVPSSRRASNLEQIGIKSIQIDCCFMTSNYNCIVFQQTWRIYETGLIPDFSTVSSFFFNITSIPTGAISYGF